MEVDIVLYGKDGLWVIEVTNSRRVGPDDLRHLRAFAGDYPESHRLLLYRGSERLRRDDVLCVPCDEFLAGLHPRSLPPGSDT